MPTKQINGLAYHWTIRGAGDPLVLLHGFAGSAQSWENLIPRLATRHQVIAPDLPGHGRTARPAEPARYAMAAASADLVALLDSITPEPVHLLGYSMGGRLALYFALHHPDRVRSLILESASPGLAAAEERRTRQAADEALAERIERQGIGWFAGYWAGLPLFASQARLPEAVRQTLLQQRQDNDPAGLAGSLRGMGTGAQPALWDQLGGFDRPTLLVVGELDTKFRAIGRQMAAALPAAQLAVIPACGHAPHLEDPDAFHACVANFLAAGDQSRATPG
ncbi:MAG: 2-succinyl-6-hydroxy-2,4-cyclohexadiene-1-carboxylate synthase [Rhodocyclaceae bacterium]